DGPVLQFQDTPGDAAFPRAEGNDMECAHRLPLRGRALCAVCADGSQHQRFDDDREFPVTLPFTGSSGGVWLTVRAGRIPASSGKGAHKRMTGSGWAWNDLFKIAKEAAEAAAQVHFTASREGLRVARKGSAMNLVTEVDREAERRLVEVIRAARPDDSIV